MQDAKSADSCNMNRVRVLEGYIIAAPHGTSEIQAQRLLDFINKFSV